MLEIELLEFDWVDINMAEEKKTTDSHEPTQSASPAADALCSNAPDKEKCEEFVEKRLGEASNNIDLSSKND